MASKPTFTFSQKSSLVNDLLKTTCQKLGFNFESVFNDLQKNGIQQTILKHVFTLTHKPLEHAKLAGAITMWNHYQRSPLTIRGYIEKFREYLRDDVIQFMENHEEKIQSILEKNFYRDFDMTYFSASTILDTYLSRQRYDEDPIEIPQLLYWRVAIGEFCSEGFERVCEIYERFSTKQGTPSSPTMFNMGFKNGAPSSCMIFEPDDSLDDILMTCSYEAGMASKNNAGLGIFLGNLRHSDIGRQGKSQGILPLIKLLDDQVRYINQGGRRPGALTVSTNIHHYDTPEFINVVDKVGEEQTRANKINTSLILNDMFMKRCQDGDKFTFFCPKQTRLLNTLHGEAFERKYIEYEEKADQWNRYNKYLALKKLTELTKLNQSQQSLYNDLSKEFDNFIPERVDARTYDADVIMDQICDIQLKVGMPYIVHGCNANRKNNMCNVGPIRVNLCQEVFIPTKPREQTACCNLSSLALNSFVKNGVFDYLEFAKCTRDFVVCLNKVIDKTSNVSEKVIKSNQLNRPIGIGVNGFSDMCALMDIPAVDVTKLPKRIGVDNYGDAIYEYVDITQTAPDYDNESLKERVMNNKLDELNWMIWSCMYYNALLSSMNEAKIHGPYENFWTSPTAQGKLQYHLWQEEERITGRKYSFKLYPADPSMWGQKGSWDQLIDDIKKYGLRNALLLTCMPTASSANVIGNCESTEFHMQNIYTRKVQSGDYPVMNYHMVKDLTEIGIWNQNTYNSIVKNDGSILYIPEEDLSHEQVVRLRFLKEKYLTMWELPQKIIIQLAAQRQVFIDHSQSMNLYIAHPTKEILKAIHMYTWQMGLKTGMYYLRSKAAGEALKIGKEKSVPTKEIKGELKDDDMTEIIKIITKVEEDKKEKDKLINEEIINQTLMSASRPQEISMCIRGQNGECLGCE